MQVANSRKASDLEEGSLSLVQDPAQLFLVPRSAHHFSNPSASTTARSDFPAMPLMLCKVKYFSAQEQHKGFLSSKTLTCPIPLHFP